MRSKLLSLALVAACSSTTSTPNAQSESTPTPPQEAEPKPVDEIEAIPDPKPVEASADELQAAGKSIEAFTFDLYKTFEGDDNIIASPASVALALGMTFEGAKGETADEFEQVLRVEDSGLDVAKWHAAIGGMGGTWSASKPAGDHVTPPEIAVANRLFGEQTVAFNDDFLGRVSSNYAAPLQPMDFAKNSEGARVKINEWVEGQTKERIKDLIPSGGVGPATALVLANAIYFKAAWAKEFNEAATKDAPFFAKDAEIAVPTMHNTLQAEHGETADASMLSLRYQGGPYAMVIVLPKAKDGLAAIEQGLSASSMSTALESMTSKRVAVALPKFKLAPSDSLRLAEPLSALGLKRAFGEGADFSGMAPASAQIRISEVFHKGFIEVDEKGTEAAAATAVAMRAGSAAPTGEPVAFNVDRPFLFMIRDVSRNTTMFIGRVTKPTT